MDIYKIKKPLRHKNTDLNKFYKDIIDILPGHVYWKDKNGAYLGCNLEQTRDAGFLSSDEMLGKTDFDMPWHIQAEYLQAIDRKIYNLKNPLYLKKSLNYLMVPEKFIYLTNGLSMIAIIKSMGSREFLLTLLNVKSSKKN